MPVRLGYRMYSRVGVLLLVAVALHGCATRRGPQFEPMPLPEVGVRELEPVKPSNTTELLRAAEREFKAANAAQEKGDKEGALQHYNKMLQLLIDANLDPVIFYNLRREFARILDSTSQQTLFFERRAPFQWPDGATAGPMVVGDLPIPFPLPPRVIQEINEIREVYPRGFQTGLNRSFQYAPYIRAQLAEGGLPQDLLWLAIVESWFNPRAYSRAGAAGMWQFMRDTGRRYGLRIDSYIDERYNWERSTQAAISYLKDLYAQFGEWPVAIAAYNMGEGGMERAVAAAGGERDIWKLLESPGARLMQEETRKFYPKLVASIIVASSPERYGFTLNPMPPQDYIRVTVEGSYTLAELEKACGLGEGVLKELNPEILRGVTPPTGQCALAVPSHAHTLMLAALESVPKHSAHTLWAMLGGSGDEETDKQPGKTSHPSATTYVVKRGDTLSAIASRFGVSVTDLMKANHIRSSKGLIVGKRLTIPSTGRSAEAKTTTASATPETRNTDSPLNSLSERQQSMTSTQEQPRKSYRVQRGDTLAEVAKKHNVSVKDLQAWNNLGNKTNIRINDVLYVAPPIAGAQSSESLEKREHVVKPGESLSAIATAYGVRLEDLLEWNNLSAKSIIRANDKLTVYAKATAQKPEGVRQPPAANAAQNPNGGSSAQRKAFGGDMYTVVAGDTAGKIAQKHGISLGDFLTWNNLTEKSVLQVGQKYRVSAPGETQVASTSSSNSTSAAVSGPAPVAGEGEKKTYRVLAGENPSSIAKKYGVRTVDVLRWNGWEPTRLLKVGEPYVIYEKTADSTARNTKNEEKPATTQTDHPIRGEPVVHKVTAGQNPTTIARKYNVTVAELFQWNNWPKDHVLQVGESVKVFPKR